MPTYLCHGFRWQRRSIRVYVVVQNLDDASPEWIIPAKSATCILDSFYNLFDFLPYCSPSGPGFASDSDGDDSYALQQTHRDRDRSRSASVHAPSHRSRSQSRGIDHRSRSHSRQPSHHSPALSRQPSRSHSRQPSRSQMSLLGDGRATIASTHSDAPKDDFSTQDWSVVKVLEEYDPQNLTEVSRPYAYVADYVVRVDLSVSIAEEMHRYEERARADRDPPMLGHASDETGRKKGNKRTGWFEKLRDQLQRGEDIRWYIVVNGDEVRDWPDDPPERRVARRPEPTPEQRQHHAQYVLQQSIFEGKDRHHRRPQTASVHSHSPRPTRTPDGRPVVPEKDFPPIRPSIEGHAPPKPAKGGGIRRLFGRAKTEEL